ncbi:hypothetical protein CHUAL_013279 [Chamberlinius hualienensis]
MKYLTLLLIVSCAVVTLAASLTENQYKPQPREKRFISFLARGLGGLFSGLNRRDRAAPGGPVSISNDSANVLNI